MYRLLSVGCMLMVACSGRDGTNSVGDVAVDTTGAMAIARIDTLRDALGAPFSPSYATVVLGSTDGAIAIDNDEKQVVRFDSTGRQTRVAGRKGGGPGEFQWPTAVFVLPRDSVAVWDAGLRRLTYYDRALTFDRTELFEQWDFGGVDDGLVGRMADGRWVARVTRTRTNPDERAGVRSIVDSARLVVGVYNAKPSEFLRLPLRRGVNVTSTSGKNSSVRLLRLHDVNAGIGTICERGVVLVDSLGIRQVATNGAVITTTPHAPDRTAAVSRADREMMVKMQMVGGLDALPEASSIRAALDDIADGHPRRVAPHFVDVAGGVWYSRGEAHFRSNAVLDRVDSLGHTDAALRVDGFNPRDAIGERSLAMQRFDPHSEASVYLLARLPSPIARANELGRCASSFRY